MSKYLDVMKREFDFMKKREVETKKKNKKKQRP